MKIKPDFWNQELGSLPRSLYVTLLCLKPTEELDRPYAPLAILTRLPLPKIPPVTVYLGLNNVHTDVVLRQFGAPLLLTQEDLQLLTSYTLDGIFSDVFNKVYQKDADRMSYWLAPVALRRKNGTDFSTLEGLSLSDIKLDHESMRAVENGRTLWTPGSGVEQWCNKFLGMFCLQILFE
jgi:hypothetical protein